MSPQTTAAPDRAAPPAPTGRTGAAAVHPASSAPAASAGPGAVAAGGVALRFDGVQHRYGDFVAVADVDLHTRPGELVALLGPSGCGKTTLLRIVAGLLQQTAGHVQIGLRVVDALPTGERGVGIVFQNYALFPHMTVQANVAYGLRARGQRGPDVQRRVAEMLDLVQMSHLAGRLPRELSGGQQQRVALARTLAVRPQVLLLDEPFSALDKNLRLDMQIEIRRIQQELGITTLLVTHDQDEAMSMADRIAVMNKGRVEQFDTPEAVYDRPATLFVAGFVGTANLLPGRLQRDVSGYRFDCDGGGRLQLPDAGPCTRDGAALLSLRPEHLELCAPGGDAPEAQVSLVLPLGPQQVVELRRPGGQRLKLTLPRLGLAAVVQPGQTVGLALRPGAPAAVFLPEVG